MSTDQGSDLGFSPIPCPHCGGRVRRFIPPPVFVKIEAGNRKSKRMKITYGIQARCFSCFRDVTDDIKIVSANTEGSASGEVGVN